MRKKTDDQLRLLEGLQTIETAAKALGITQQAALNLLSRLKKQGHITVSGGGRQKRIYKITMRKQLPRDPGMFDIINKYSPVMKLNPWYDHQVHGPYGPEEALIDAIQTGSFRVLLAAMHLFGHIKNWQKLHQLAAERNLWPKIGALYDVSRLYIKIRCMPNIYRLERYPTRKYLIKTYRTKEEKFIPIQRVWNVAIPFRFGDIRGTLYPI